MASKRCKYCGAPLADDGFCSRPCAPGELERKIAEESKEKTKKSSK